MFELLMEATKPRYEVAVTFLYYGTDLDYKDLEDKLVQAAGVNNVFIVPVAQFEGQLFCRGTFWPFSDINRAESFAALARFILSADGRAGHTQTHSTIIKTDNS